MTIAATRMLAATAVPAAATVVAAAAMLAAAAVLAAATVFAAAAATTVEGAGSEAFFKAFDAKLHVSSLSWKNGKGWETFENTV